MEAEFNSLEEKIGQLVHLCVSLRSDNRALRQQVLNLEQENLLLKQKVDGAKERVAALLNHLPEDEQ
jgi:cell division protein ZapB